MAGYGRPDVNKISVQLAGRTIPKFEAYLKREFCTGSVFGGVASNSVILQCYYYFSSSIITVELPDSTIAGFPPCLHFSCALCSVRPRYTNLHVASMLSEVKETEMSDQVQHLNSSATV